MPVTDAAPTPPMGWDSRDCYGAAVTESEFRENAEYMARHLKDHGWEYVVRRIPRQAAHAGTPIQGHKRDGTPDRA